MKKTIFYLLLFLGFWSVACANPEIITFQSPLVWRADGTGDYLFKDNGKLSGTRISDDGAIEYVGAPGTYELNSPYATNGIITNIGLTWEFSGQVTMEVSVTGNSADYTKVVNGVPLELKTRFGNRIKWRSTLAAGSRLTQVKIIYQDITGVAGSFGTPELSGFNFKKPIELNGSASGELYHFAVPITIGESLKAQNCEVNLKGVLQADFDDVRFTCADGQTILPYYLESITGSAGQRKAKFWVKVPQLPKEGLPIYVYYGRLGGESLSSGEETFDFYYNFKPKNFNEKKWEAADLQDGLLEYKLKSENEIKTLDRAAYDNKEKIINFFKAGTDFEFARLRKIAEPMPAVNVATTADLSEEIPNLAEFQAAAIAPNGDLALADAASAGQYTSAFIYPTFKVRIMVPEFVSSAALGSKLGIDITAKADTLNYKENCESGNYYYASKGDFTAGQILRWRAKLSRSDAKTETPKLEEFSLDYRPGTISVVAPAKGETLAAGSTYALSWSALEYEPSYKMKLTYSPDAGKTWSVISESALNSGKYSWQAPTEFTDKGLIRIADALAPEIYGESNPYFSIGAKAAALAVPPAAPEALTPEAAALETQVKQEVQADARKKVPRPGTNPYELLIKVGSNPSPNGYKDGDIVMIKPAGHLWGDMEKEKFFIVKVYLTPDEARQLMGPLAAKAKGLGRRRFRLDVQKIGLPAGATPDMLSAYDRASLSADIGEVEEKK